MSDTIPQLLSEFETAVQNGNYRDARTALDSLRQRYDRKQASEQIRKTRALAVREDPDRSAGETASDLVAQHARVNMVRGGFLATASGYVASPEAVDPGEIGDAVSKLRESESRYADASEAAEPAIGAVDLPAQVAVASISTGETVHAKGVPFSMDARVTNAGDEPATGVSVTATSEAAFEFAASSASDSVAARSDETYGFEVTAGEAGDHAVTVEVTADDAGSASKQATVRIRGKVALVESGAESLGELIEVLRTEQPLRKGRNDALVSKLENAASRLDKAVGFAEQGKRKQADNMLNAATKTLGAALNQLDAIRNGDGSGAGSSGDGKDNSGSGKNNSSGGKDDYGKGNSGNGAGGSGASADVIRSIERQLDGVVEELTRAKRADI